MSANKRKILENAQKYLQRGQPDKALKEYQAALQADPRDTGTRLKIGDIHLKLGNKDEAVAAYLKVAEQFMKDGFDARAVALYKQILKIDAARADVHIPLAELYTRLGLTTDAMASLQSAADAYHREGRKRDALDLLRKMARLDPTNITSRLKIAELLQQAGMKDEALAELDEVAREVERVADAEEMKRVYERLLELDPARHGAHVGLGRVALGQTDFRAAEEHAREALELQPEAGEALELMAEVLRESGREDELEPIYRRLADVYRGRGDESRAREILQRYVSSDGLELGGDAAALGADELESGGSPFGAPGDAALAVDPPELEEELVLEDEPAPPPTRAVPAAARPAPAPPAGDPDQLVAEANVYLRYGKAEKAIASLESALAVAPEHRGALTKLAEVMEQRGDLERAAGLRSRVGSTSPLAPRSPAAIAPPAPAPAIAPAPDDDEIGELVFATVPGTSAAAQAPAAAARDESGPLELDIDLELDGGETSPPPSADALARVPAEPPLGEPDLDVDLDLDLGGDGSDAGSSASLDMPEPAADGAVSRSGGSSTSTAVQIVEELEEAEFYFHQDLLEEAEAVYKRVLVLAPSHPQAMLRLGEIEAARGREPGASLSPLPIPPAEATIAFADPEPSLAGEEGSFDLAGELALDDETGSSPIAVPGEDTSTQPSVTTPGLEPEGAFALDLDDTGSSSSDVVSREPPVRGLATTRPVVLDPASVAPSGGDEAAEDELASAIASAPPVSEPEALALPRAGPPEILHAPPLTATQALAPDVTPPTPGDEFDLAAELSDVFAEANRAPEDVATQERRFDEGFHAVFDEFKRGVKRVVGDGDHETHFDLGIAYREMGLLEDAVGEFAQALGSPARRLAALHMMGLCALDLKRPADAVAHLEQALSLPDLPGDQACALHCDLVRGFVALGDAFRARAALERAVAIDATFPELASRHEELASLEAGTSPVAEDAVSEAEPAESFESFDDLIAEAGSEPQADAASGATTPAAPAPATPPASPSRKRKISFL